MRKFVVYVPQVTIKAYAIDAKTESEAKTLVQMKQGRELPVQETYTLDDNVWEVESYDTVGYQLLDEDENYPFDGKELPFIPQWFVFTKTDAKRIKLYAKKKGIALKIHARGPLEISDYEKGTYKQFFD